MKILSMTWSIYDSRLEIFSSDHTGGDLMIRNICEYIGRIHESYLFIGRFKVPELDLGNIHIVGTTIYPDNNDSSLDKNERHLRTMTNAFENVIERLHPDIVNFHGIGVLMQRCIGVCTRKNIPYVYTDHLFIGSSADFKGYDTNVRWEKEVYSIPGIRVIAVSAGMKKKILKNFPHIPYDDITVIRNATNFTAEWKPSNLKQRYGLDNKKVLLCVGTITYRKNQCQLVDAFQLLSKDIQDRIKVIFCGVDNINGELQKCISDAGMGDRMVYAGAVSNEEMKEYYSVADGLVMPSYAEGLSIAALEAIAYGLPVILFADSECADDLNDKEVVCFAKDRSDGGLAEAVRIWDEKTWNKEYIINYSKYFNMERVADEYIKYYMESIENYQLLELKGKNEPGNLRRPGHCPGRIRSNT